MNSGRATGWDRILFVKQAHSFAKEVRFLARPPRLALGRRLMVGRLPLEQAVQVRVLPPQPSITLVSVMVTEGEVVEPRGCGPRNERVRAPPVTPF